MAAYEYLSLDTEGKEKKGVLEADTAKAARQQLRSQGLTPLEVIESSQHSGRNNTKSKSSTPVRFRGGIKVSELAMLTRQIATLVSSGTPLEEALAAVSKHSERQRIKALLLSVRAKVLEGHSLASSLREFPRVFPEIYVASVEAGEQSGHLENVLERLADYLEDRQAANSTVSKALIYPSMLVVASFLIVGFLLGYVVPQVIEVFDNMNQELPTLTRMMLACSGFVRDWWLVMFAVIVIVVFLFKQGMRREGFKYKVHEILLKVPLVSRLIRGFNAAQFARTLSILAASGVPVLQALGIAAQVITNRPMRTAVDRAAAQVREGSTLGGSLERTGYFPPILLHLVSSGEASGKLPTMLEKAATNQERELESILALFLGLFEPVIILIMGGVVLTIVLAILLPIFEMNQLVG